MKSSISLFFSDTTSPELLKVVVKCPYTHRELISERGSDSPSGSSFGWTKAVKGLSHLLLKSAAKLPSEISGKKGSLASSFDYAMSKKPLWLVDMFGTDSFGTPNARRYFNRFNAERKRPGPVKIALNQNTLSPNKVRIYFNSTEVTAPSKILSICKHLDPINEKAAAYNLSPLMNLIFSGSALSSPSTLNEGITSSLNNLQACGFINETSKSRSRIESLDQIKFCTSSWKGKPPLSYLDELAKHPFKISCPPTSVAHAEVLLEIKKEHLPDIEIDLVDYCCRDQALRLARGVDYHFVLSCDEPMFLIGGIENYRRVMPISFEKQSTFKRKTNFRNSAQRVVVANLSTAEAQYRTQIGIPRNAEVKVVEPIEVPEVASTLEPGELIITWDPFSFEYRKNPRLEEVTDKQTYKTWSSLYCNSNYFGKRSSIHSLEILFSELFLAKWNQYQSQKLEFKTVHPELENSYNLLHYDS